MLNEQSEKALRINQLRLIVIISCVIFVVMLAYTINWINEYNKNFENFVATKAVVVAHKEIKGKVYDVLQYNIDSNEHNVTSEYTSRNDIGDEVTIYYHKDNVLATVCEIDNRTIILPLISTIFGVTSGALLIVYVVIDRNYKKELTLKKNKS